MALLKVLRAHQVTLPPELRKQFKLAPGDYVEAQAMQEGILLKPVKVVPRKKAWDAVIKVLDRVHAKLPASTLSPQAQEEWIAKEVKAFRREKQPKRHA